MKIIQNIFTFLIFYVYTAETNTDHFEDDFTDNSEAEYYEPYLKQELINQLTQNINKLKPSDVNKHNSDFSHAINQLYTNYTSINVSLNDIYNLYLKGIITDNQVITLWELFLNIKTTRNNEWFNLKNILSSIPINVIICYITFILVFINRPLLIKSPNFNITLMFILLIFNISNCFVLHRNGFSFTCSLSLLSALQNLYFIYLSLVIIAGHKHANFSLNNIKQFNSKVHFLTKLGFCFAMYIVSNYFTTTAFRSFFNLLSTFFLFDRCKKIIANYYRLTINEFTEILQPLDNSLNVIFGLFNLIFSQLYFYSNLEHSYDLNIFLFFNNIVTFIYFLSFGKFVNIQKNKLGKYYLKYLNSNSVTKMDLTIVKFRSDTFQSESIYDFLLMFINMVILILALNLNSLFLVFLSLVFLSALTQHILPYLPIRISRIIATSLLFFYFMVVLNIPHMNYSYLNEVFNLSIRERKVLDALKFLIKNILLTILIFYLFLSNHFTSLFIIDNYSLYRHLLKDAMMSNPTTKAKLSQVFTTSTMYLDVFFLPIEESKELVREVLTVVEPEIATLTLKYINWQIYINNEKKNVVLILFDLLFMYLLYTFMNIVTVRDKDYLMYFLFYFYKVLIFVQWILLFPEYCKNNFFRNIIILLNITLAYRLPELIVVDAFIRAALFLISICIYLILPYNNLLMNLYLDIYLVIHFYKFKKIIIFIVLMSILTAKEFCHSMRIKNLNVRIVFMLVICIVLNFIISGYDNTDIDQTYFGVKEWVYDYTHLDIIGWIENLCFRTDGETIEEAIGKNILDYLIMFNYY
jgi:hypothetical protein